MADEEKETRTPETQPEDEDLKPSPVEAAEAKTEDEPYRNHIAEKRGRMVAAGIITAVGVSIIAVIVAGIFHFTSKLLIVCPTDLPVNDPSPKLWSQIVSEKQENMALGVSGQLAVETKFKQTGSENKPN
ncbi:hypothetical protein [Desulfomonile tiedjei]|uniref:Uncharacterized protein n=1 Tax=Desulfomonile tiedjei (strain ATCC 49306 / DSM 6799 / DCB-1) TaxID=706587 RepID=I4C3F4_DESTA|nr:hypothetical protein [Desulfomonile tiedjei]AFM24095.1 hypothetical protein Desti_1383 [Desulfomonile tiedjei DSM 6799]